MFVCNLLNEAAAYLQVDRGGVQRGDDTGCATASNTNYDAALSKFAACNCMEAYVLTKHINRL